MRPAAELIALARKVLTSSTRRPVFEGHELAAEVLRLHEWADGMTDAALKERRLADARIKELTAELAKPRTEEATQTGGPVYLIDGKPYRQCTCPRREGKCPRGVERNLETTQLSRCLIPVDGFFELTMAASVQSPQRRRCGTCGAIDSDPCLKTTTEECARP